MANEGFHEAAEDLSDETKDMPRAIVSLMEELEAVDWYNQRVDACKDPALKKILEHNRDEEKEHAAMMLEWIRRQDPTMDKELRDSLFTDGEIGHHD
ncbi:ferritin [Gammaproteobacteria bacterium]|jgi:ferritin-like protein|nr:ferritin [Gammaproteobacteria bacterium]